MNTIAPTACRRFFAFAALAGALAATSPSALGQPPAVAARAKPALRFTVTYDPAITDSFTGRVYVMLSAQERRDPRFGPSWFGNTPFFALDVEAWPPGSPLVFDESALGFPGPLREIEPGTYSIQAVLRRNPDSAHIGRGEGSAYSPPIRREISTTAGGIELHVDRLVEARPFQETDRIKLVERSSDLLSAFHGRDVLMRAAVILPPDYAEHPTARYPAYYWIGGFSSTHRAARWMSGLWDATGYADRIVRVVLDPSCYGGHHVFADSDNNGPRGKALVTELIPHLEERFRLVAAPTARFVSGHSSGGWSSLWLQITYPDFFGGVWSLAPDPVDFTRFQLVNLYEPGVNMYVDEAGQRRPVARRGGEPFAWYEPFTRMELVHGDGGQLRSFDWVFSPRGGDGRPRRLYDPATGDVNGAVAAAWRRYDIRLILEANWPSLGPKLAGKIYVIVGDKDTFYLDGAVRTLRDALTRLGSDAVIEIVPGADHSSFATIDLRKRIDEALLAVFERHHGSSESRPESESGVGTAVPAR
ncbi:MAG: alpha/beta hydrolase-fold protein [Planctomycetota bacterium]|jgi:S-formylglutathione hydrolase FrmB